VLSRAKGRGFDRMYVAHMARHHKGAISVARTEQAQGRHQATRDLAATIEATEVEFLGLHQIAPLTWGNSQLRRNHSL